jgi:hypothetical protein
LKPKSIASFILFADSKIGKEVPFEPCCNEIYIGEISILLSAGINLNKADSLFVNSEY